MRFMFSARRFKTRGSGGFTLPEMAIVVVIAGLLLVTLLPALRATQSAAALGATQSNLQTLLRATAAYVAANGCLPCPTPGNKIFGFEQGRVGTPGNTPCGVCASSDGIAPFGSLGLDPATAKDGWGHWITMHVDPALASPALCMASEIAANAPGCSKNDRLLSGFCRAESRSGAALAQRISIRQATGGTTTASALFLSHGANGYGSYRATALNSANLCDGSRLDFPAGASCGGGARGAHGEELCNDKCRTADALFYDIQRGENFDDLLAYADRNALVSMLGSGSCATPW